MKKIMAIVCAVIMMTCNVVTTFAQSEMRVYSYAEINNMNMRMLEDIANKYETKIRVGRYEDEDIWQEFYSVNYYEARCDRWYGYTITYTNHKNDGTTEVVNALMIHNNNN